MTFRGPFQPYDSMMKINKYLKSCLKRYRLINIITFVFQKFEQEKYSLQREVELKNRMVESLNFECDALKQQQNMQLEKQREQLERVHGQEINQLNNKVWDVMNC